MTMYHVTWMNLEGYRGHMAFDLPESANILAHNLTAKGYECVRVERY